MAVTSKQLESREPIKVARWLAELAWEKGVRSHRGKFWAWIGGRWQERGREWVEDVAWRTLEDTYVLGEEGERNNFKLEIGSVGNVIRALEAITRVSDREMPVWLGAEPFEGDQSGVVAFEDVLVDAGTGKVVGERGMEWFDGAVVPVAWDEGAKCERWERALEEWSGGDGAWKELLQRWMGYCLMGHRKYGKWLLMYGKIRSGKGTIAWVVDRLVAGQVLDASLGDLADMYKLTALRSAKVLNITEAGEENQQIRPKVAGLLKSIIGQDVLVTEAKYKDPTACRPRAVVMMQANEIPRLPNEARGLSGKMLLLPFEQSWSGREQWDLREQLEQELAGIAAWAVRGAVALVEAARVGEGLWPAPSGSAEGVHEYELVNNPWDSFLEARFVRDPDGFVGHTVVRVQWDSWAGRNKVPVPKGGIHRLASMVIAGSTWGLKRVQRANGEKGLRGLVLRSTPTDGE